MKQMLPDSSSLADAPPPPDPLRLPIPSLPVPWAKAGKWALLCLLLGSLLALVWFSNRLAGIRIYQVDECQNVYVARILETGQAKVLYTSPSLLHLPLWWLGRGAVRAVDLFVSARFFMLEIFWLNLVLIAVATGERLFSRRGLLALIGAATLAPLWDYGFEIRHDNLLLTGLLLTWCAVRVRPAGAQSYVVAGAVAVALQFVAFKAFVYTVPLSLLILALPHPGNRTPRLKLVLAWGAGALGMLIALRLTYGAAGLWGLFLADFHRVSGDASGGNRFGPWESLARLLGQTPLLLALTGTALLAVAADLWRRRKVALTWESSLPEAFLFVVALGALIINPAPYPYNLLHLVPYGFLLAFRHASVLLKTGGVRPALIPALGAILVFTHLVPFGLATRRHWDFTSFHQESRMQLAEDLTDPAKDRVYDGVGLVPTRSSIGFHWFLHSLNIQGFTKGLGPRVRDMLAAQPAAVILPNYRTDWLTGEDHAFIREHYVALADDLLVLGKVLPPGGGTLEIVHPGRYRISSLQGSDLVGTYPEGFQGLSTPEDEGSLTGTVDGLPLSNRPVELGVGIHQIESTPDCQPAVVWVGPRLDRVHRVASRDHRWLFVNWY